MEKNKVYHGNNLDILKTFEDNSIDSIVTDPPYGISFMNKKWDYDVPNVELWKECLRVLKPGGHILVACGTRTQHRMAVNIEDAGFEIRDIIAWVYGSGFPKSLDISKAIDKHLGAERKVIGKAKGVGNNNTNSMKNGLGGSQEFASEYDLTEASTQEAKQWQGWGTALKPSMELWTLAQKPREGSFAENVLKHGVGGINIDECRIGNDLMIGVCATSSGEVMKTGLKSNYKPPNHIGRFPANFLHDGSDEVVSLFPNVDGAKSQNFNEFNMYGGNALNESKTTREGFKEMYDDSGSAARFFYTAKASQNERNFGLYQFEESNKGINLETKGRTYNSRCAICGKKFIGPEDNICHCENPVTDNSVYKQKNIHPTVKPIDLMKYLVRLITPKGGVCLDPFLGSGTTAVACKEENFHYIGIELMEEYVKIAEARIKAAVCQLSIFDL